MSDVAISTGDPDSYTPYETVTDERPLEVYEVLEEEYARLHPAHAPPDVRWDFRESDIRDLPDLGRMLAEALQEKPVVGEVDPGHDASRAILHGTPELHESLVAYRHLGPEPDGDAAASVAFRAAVVKRLNALLDENLVGARAFRPFRADARVRDADAEPEQRRR